MRFIPYGPAVVLVTVAMVYAADPSESQLRATAALEQAVKTDPNNPDLWIPLGFAYRKMEQLDRATQAFEKAAVLNPKSQEALYMLGLIYEKQNRKADARRVWKQYLDATTDPEKRSMAEKHLHQLGQ